MMNYFPFKHLNLVQRVLRRAREQGIFNRGYGIIERVDENKTLVDNGIENCIHKVITAQASEATIAVPDALQ